MKIRVFSKKETIINEKGKENTFYRYFTSVKIQVIDDSDGKDLGIQEKSLRVHFTKDAMKKLKSDKVFSIFECKGEDVGHPFVYHIPKDKKDNESWAKNDVWIRDFDSETEIPFTPANNTCEFLTDEPDTESVEIVED